jgi:hypothetical protein
MAPKSKNKDQKLFALFFLENKWKIVAAALSGEELDWMAELTNARTGTQYYNHEIGEKTHKKS